MTPQEAQLIREVFARVRAMGARIDDVDAARLVDQELRANAAAGLDLVKVVVGLERERDEAVAQAQALAAELDELRARGAPQAGGGLFGGAPGPWGASRPAEPAPAPMPMPQSGPWGGAQAMQPGPWGAQPQPQQQGGGFWSSALRTGAGVAGGLFAFEAMKGLFGGHGGYGAPMGAGFLDGGPRVVENVTIYEGDHGRGFDHGRAEGGGFGGESGSTGHDSAIGPGGIVADDIDFLGGGGSDDDYA